ncbi:MAG: hypothetical protein ACI8UX_002219 [Psychromonas sp.]|jgi:hypothetical protein
MLKKRRRMIVGLHQMMEWLTGFDEKGIDEFIEEKVTFEESSHIASLNANPHLRPGVICG